MAHLLSEKKKAFVLASGFSSSLNVGNIVKIDFDVFFAIV